MAHAPALKPCHAHLCDQTPSAHKTSPEHRKMAGECQHPKLLMSAYRSSLSTPSCGWRATFSGIVATPLFLRYTPSSHPICETSIAIVGRRSSPHRGTPTCLLAGATLSVNPAAPFLFWHTPSSLPICEPVSTIVWVCRAWWQGWLHWWQDWLHWWQDWLHWWDRSRWRRSGWRRSGRAPNMVNSATPRFLVSCPSILCVHSAIEWVQYSWSPWWHRVRWCGRWRRRWCWRWCGRWCGERSGRNCHRGLRQSRGGACSGTASPHGAAAEVLLCLRPCCFPHHEAIIAIEKK